MNTVAQNRINLNMAMAKKRPIKPNRPMLRYQTPILSVMGHSGNITAARIKIKAPPA